MAFYLLDKIDKCHLIIHFHPCSNSPNSGTTLKVHQAKEMSILYFPNQKQWPIRILTNVIFFFFSI